MSFHCIGRQELRRWGKGKHQYYNADTTDLEVGQVIFKGMHRDRFYVLGSRDDDSRPLTFDVAGSRRC